MGESLLYNRELALPSFEFVNVDHSSIAESGASFETVNVPLRPMISDVDVRVFSQTQLSELNDIRAGQVEKKLKALGRLLGQKLITGKYASGATVAAAIPGITVTSVGPNQDSSRHGFGVFEYLTSGTTLKYRAPGDKAFGAAVNISPSGTYVIPSDNPNKFVIVTSVTGSLVAADARSTVTINTSSEEFDGLLSLVPTTHAQALISGASANGDALTFALMDRAMDEFVKNKGGRPFWIGNAKIKAKFLSLLRGLNGNNVEHVVLPGLNGPVPIYRGVPFLQTDWIPNNEVKGGATDLSSLFLAYIDGDGLSFTAGSLPMSATLDTSPSQTRVMGLSIRDLGELESKEAWRTRISMYAAPKLESELTMCRIYNLITA